jgi:hypothetical protein
MRTVILVSGLVALCAAGLAHGQDTFQGSVVASGVRYRVSGVKSVLMATPEFPFDAGKPERAPTQDETLSRCDEFVALALKARGFADTGRAGLVRGHVEPMRGSRNLVVYEQRNQGYKVLGAGGRLELDAYGRILFAGLTYESENFPIFRAPLNSVALENLAASAVPHRIVEPPIRQELMIDPMDDAPAQLRAYVVYRVQVDHAIEGWEVILDAVTGRIINSFSLMMHAESPPAGEPR